jgi:hypothetical protein
MKTTTCIKKLRDAAEAGVESRRAAEFGPGGGNPNARREQHLEWIAADIIADLERKLDSVKLELKAIEHASKINNEYLLSENARLREAAKAVLTCRWPLDSKSVGSWFDGLQAAMDALEAALAAEEKSDAG